jgi:hypothetical protein
MRTGPLDAPNAPESFRIRKGEAQAAVALLCASKLVSMKLYAAIVILGLGAVSYAQQAATPPPAGVQQQTPADIPVDQANQQQARELVERMLRALGGEAYLNYQERQEEGRTYGFYQGEARGTGAPFWRFWKWPDKERTELLKRRDWVLLINGEQGWESTFRGTRQQREDEMADYLLRREHSLENVLRVWLRQPGTALFYEGPAITDQRQTERITIMNANYQAVTVFIEPRTYLPVRKTHTVRDPETRQRIEEAEVWDNYRMVQGVNTPHSFTRLRNGLTQSQRFIRNVRYNTGLPDSMFAAPQVTMTDGRR